MLKIVSFLFPVFLGLFISGCGIEKIFLHPPVYDTNTTADHNDTNTTASVRLPRLCFHPNTTPLEKILASKKLKPGIPLYIRIFKKEKVFELWGKQDKRYTFLKSYPICHYSGYLGPKLRSGDKQAPEGVYVLTRKSLHPHSRYHLALNIQYPNRYDRNRRRTGDLIMIHGKCASTGCFAMGNSQIEEIYKMVEKALEKKRSWIYVAIYPFRMTDDNMLQYGDSYWYPFWANLKTGYDYFEQTHVPPFVGVKGPTYVFQKRGSDINTSVATTKSERNETKAMVSLKTQ